MSYKDLKMEGILEASDGDGEHTSIARQQFEERLQEYRKAFSLFDKDENNTILCSDLKDVLKYLDKDSTDDEVEEMLNTVIRRRNEKDFLVFEEFVEAMENEKAMTTESLVREAFTVMDPDGNGYVTLANIKHVIANLGFDFTEEEIQYMIDEADPKERGKIEYEGLIGLISGDNETLAKAYQKRVEQDKEIARRREAERSTFMAAASKTDKGIGVPDFAELASQFDHGHYDKYSRKASRHRVQNVSANRPVRKPAVTRTRLAYLQKQDKAIGADYNTDSNPTGDMINYNTVSPEFRTGSVTDIRTPRGVQYTINSAPKDDRGYHDSKYLNPVKIGRNVDHRLLEPSYYLKKTKDSNKTSSMHVGHVHSMTDELQQELRRLRNVRGNSNDGMPRSISVLTKPSNNTTPLSFTDESKRARITKTPQLTYTQRAAAREELMNNKLYTSLWRSAFANALEKLQVNNTKGMMNLSTPSPLGERLQPTPIEDSYRLNINRAEKLNQRVALVSPFLDAPPKNTVQESNAFKRFTNGPTNKLRRMQVPVFQPEKYHRDFLRPNILPKIEPKPKQRDAITKSDLHRVINSLNL